MKQPQETPQPQEAIQPQETPEPSETHSPRKPTGGPKQGLPVPLSTFNKKALSIGKNHREDAALWPGTSPRPWPEQTASFSAQGLSFYRRIRKTMSEEEVASRPWDLALPICFLATVLWLVCLFHQTHLGG